MRISASLNLCPRQPHLVPSGHGPSERPGLYFLLANKSGCFLDEGSREEKDFIMRGKSCNQSFIFLLVPIVPQGQCRFTGWIPAWAVSCGIGEAHCARGSVTFIMLITSCSLRGDVTLSIKSLTANPTLRNGWVKSSQAFCF
jgi:hypothetical protein